MVSIHNHSEKYKRSTNIEKQVQPTSYPSNMPDLKTHFEVVKEVLFSHFSRQREYKKKESLSSLFESKRQN